MKTLATAQANFRANDLDGNSLPDFWREDVAGLYATRTPRGEIRLIDISIAGADDRPVGDVAKYTQPAPKAGYRYRALRFADEGPTPDPDRFAFLAYPVSVHSGRSYYIVSHENVVYGRRIGETVEPFDVYPVPEAMKEWSALD